MAILSSFAAYILNDVMQGIPGVTAKAMFGGYGLYQHGKIFGLIADECLYFKVGNSNRSTYEAHKSTPFTYTGKSGDPITMSYWLVPEEILSDEEALPRWISAALAVHSLG